MRKKNKFGKVLYYLVSSLVLVLAVICSAINPEYRKISMILSLVVLLVEIFRDIKNKDISLLRGAIVLVIVVILIIV